jgi:hypothetical protein
MTSYCTDRDTLLAAIRTSTLEIDSKKGLVRRGSRVVLFTTSACKTTNWLHGWQPERERQINHSLGDGLPNKEMWASIKSR